jgi:hypothetical protein
MEPGPGVMSNPDAGVLYSRYFALLHRVATKKYRVPSGDAEPLIHEGELTTDPIQHFSKNTNQTEGLPHARAGRVGEGWARYSDRSRTPAHASPFQRGNALRGGVAAVLHSI